MTYSFKMAIKGLIKALEARSKAIEGLRLKAREERTTAGLRALARDIEALEGRVYGTKTDTDTYRG
jgi:hypothetical protein